jgi:hypothetical protein
LRQPPRLGRKKGSGKGKKKGSSKKNKKRCKKGEKCQAKKTPLLSIFVLLLIILIFIAKKINFINFQLK